MAAEVKEVKKCGLKSEQWVGSGGGGDAQSEINELLHHIHEAHEKVHSHCAAKGPTL